MNKLYLGSTSPYRKELIEKFLNIIPINILSPDIEEKALKSEKPLFYVKRIALGKFKNLVPKMEEGFLVTADTIVTKGSRILSKPKNSEELKSYLKILSGCRHRVYTSIVIGKFENGIIVKKSQKTVQTIIKFKNLDKQEIEYYSSCSEGLNSSGGYLLDGQAARYIEFISGCYYNVIGLPISSLYKTLKGMGWNFY